MRVFVFKIYAVCIFVTATAHIIKKRDHVTITLLNNTVKSMTIPSNSLVLPDLETLFDVKGDLIKSLQVENTNIESIPQRALKNLTKLETLSINFNNKLRVLGALVFLYNKKISYLNLESNAIEIIEKNVFDGLFMEKFMLGELHLTSNKLHHLPAFDADFKGLVLLNFDNNPIKEINSWSFDRLPCLEILSLRNTDIMHIPSNILGKSSHLHSLDLRENKRLVTIHPHAFVGGKSLRTLYLSGTFISDIPYKGLENLKFLELKNTPNIWELPNGLVSIPTLKTVRVGEAQRFLCCAFIAKRAQVGTFLNNAAKSNNSHCNTVLRPFQPSPYNPEKNLSANVDLFKGFERKIRQNLLDGFIVGKVGSKNFSFPANFKDDLDFGKNDKFDFQISNHSKNVVVCPNYSGGVHYNTISEVECLPVPDALHPCDDIMGNVFLTGLSWVISILALAANSVVFCVLICTQRTMNVTKFLLLNLSFADLCLSLYLLILVSASAHTHGNYYNYVRQWQLGGGCAISGFLAVFSSQLSVFVLVVITVERYFAIVYAMYLHRRVTLKQARAAMLFCWLLSIILAFLPITGVNSYKDVAICLPFRTKNKRDLVYIGVMLSMNASLFIFVSVSYFRMYLVVRNSQLNCGHHRDDSEVAKRMAWLILTDFFCWGPIAVIGLFSAFGNIDSLGIDVKKSKYLLVVFFPINALCNPFMYAVSTSSFRRDFFNLLIRCGIFTSSIEKLTDIVNLTKGGYKEVSSPKTIYSESLFQEPYRRSLEIAKPTFLSRLFLVARNFKKKKLVENVNYDEERQRSIQRNSSEQTFLFKSLPKLYNDHLSAVDQSENNDDRKNSLARLVRSVSVSL